jgi:flagellin
MDSQALGVGSNELATEEVTVTAANLVTANSILVNDSNTAYTVEKLEAATTVSGVANTQYILRDADNNVVAASADGIAFSFAHTTNTITDDIATTNLGAAVSVSLAGGTTGINKITSGTITVVDGVSGSLDFKALSTVADSNIQLGSGTYTVTTVAASGRTDVNTANQILVNKETNEVVAVGNAAAASTTWKSLDGASTLMTTSGTLALNDTVTVTGSGGIDISSQTSADTAIDTIDTAIKSVSDERAKLGATQNRLEHTIKNLDTSSENLQAAESRIRDVDMAKEMMEFTKNNILQQAAQAMLAQANQAPQGVLQLLR